MTRAAANLHVAQPALGFQIAQLEQELGIKLLTRHSRGADPTVAGDQLYQHAVRILGEVEIARSKIRRLGSTAQHEPLTLGIAPSILLLLGSEVLTVARQTMPEVAIGLIEQPSFALTEAVARGEIDVALVNDASEGAGVSRTALIVEELLFITGAENDRLDATIGFADVLTWDLALAGLRDPIRRRVEQLAKSMDMALRVPFEVQSVPIMKKLFVQRRIGGILPYGTVHEEAGSGILQCAKIRDPVIQRTIHLLRAERRTTLQNEVQFLLFIRTLVARLVELGGGNIRAQPESY